MFGAAGAVEAFACSVRSSGWLPPTINYEHRSRVRPRLRAQQGSAVAAERGDEQ